MNEKLLLIDISNSRTKLGVAVSAPATLRLLPSQTTADLDGPAFTRIITRCRPDHIVASSVVPSKSSLLRGCVQASKLTMLSAATNLPIKVKYPRPETIGADRLANAVAVSRLYPLPAIVIDFGTAVTFDIVSHQKEYLGGVIAPGLNAMTDYLHEKTSLLPRIRVKEPKRAIGKSTMEAMQIGAVTGYRGLIREIIRSVRSEIKARRITVIATGGYADLIASSMPEVRIVNPLLTLQGLLFTRLHNQS